VGGVEVLHEDEAIPVSVGRARSSALTASSPPAEAPMPTMERGASGERSAGGLDVSGDPDRAGFSFGLYPSAAAGPRRILSGARSRDH
jgi:hypothetical protein